MCATVKRLCLWMLLLSSMRRRSRGELRGERRGEMEEGDRRCPLGLSGCSRFSRRIFTRSSFRPECLGMGGTARVSWWVTPMPACWAMPAPGFGTTNTRASQINEQSRQQRYIRNKATHTLNGCFCSVRVQEFPQNSGICLKKKRLTSHIQKILWIIN